MKDKLLNYDPRKVSQYYDTWGEKEWDRLIRSPVDEASLYIHTRMLQQYLERGMEVLEIGAGAGRFTQILAGLGCSVTVADLSPGQLAINQRKAKEFGFETSVAGWHQLDVCNMPVFEDEKFDAVVCYGGPLSYVFDQAEQAVTECHRILAKSGLFLVSVMSLWGTMHRFLDGVLEVDSDKNRRIIDTGNLTEETLPQSNHHCHMYRSAEFRTLLNTSKFEILKMSSSNVLTTGWEEQLSEVRKDDKKWDELLSMEEEACQQPGCLDAGTHLIAVCTKKNAESE